MKALLTANPSDATNCDIYSDGNLFQNAFG